MKYEVKFTNQFEKTLNQLRNKIKITDSLLKVIDVLADGGVLEAKYCDNGLPGKYSGIRECHIEPDWLLVYEIKNEVLVLMLYRLGKHSELFKK